jgi:hypothetical protein
MCPKLTRLAELVLTIPVSNAWSEKGASKVKIIKTDLRNRLKNDMLEGLMHLTVNGPDICTDQYDDLITSSIKKTGYRRNPEESYQIGIKVINTIYFFIHPKNTIQNYQNELIKW